MSIKMLKELPVKHISPLNVILDESLDITCELKSASDSICLFFVSNTFSWFLSDIKVFYQDIEIDERYLKIVKPSAQFDINEQGIFMINIKDIFLDLFSDSTDRSFSVVMGFLKNRKYNCFTMLEITLPVVEEQRNWQQLPLQAFIPDEQTRSICQSNFKIHESSTMKDIEKCIQLEEFRRSEPKDRLRLFGYCSMLKMMLSIEDSSILDTVEKCFIQHQYIQQLSKTTFKIKISKRIPECATAVRLFKIQKVGAVESYNTKDINCRIIRYERNHVIIENKPSPYNFEEKKICTSCPYSIQFIPNTYTSNMANLALKTIKDKGLENWMVNFDGVMEPPTEIVKIHHNFSWFNKNISTNEEQKMAVKNVVNKTSQAMPFVIFGPPGTGKTSTLVEAVLQIVTLNPTAKVLISANSNSACDEIAERLIRNLSVNKIYRFFAPALERKIDKANPELKPISNLRHGRNNYPTHEELCSYNVVISTLVNCGKFISAELDPNHFDYVFIDECASMAECYAAIPIAVCAQQDKIRASLVFCGDHKQLGPVFNTQHTERLGFSTSLMERVLLQDQYKIGHGYNSDLAIKLVKNFRSHGAILEYSSKHFYDSELQACQSPDIANFAIGWETLPNRNFPIIFHPVFSASKKLGTSIYNESELEKTKKYVDMLLKDGVNGQQVNPEDIGIICPYNAQRTKLKQMFGESIEIGTVEYYQGREKKIIIFSAVRSRTSNIGFLRNEKRLNVALTRAKSLMIVMGNPDTLCDNHHWREFIRYCNDNEAVAGWVPDECLKGLAEEYDADCFGDEDNFNRTLEEMMNEMWITE